LLGDGGQGGRPGGADPRRRGVCRGLGRAALPRRAPVSHLRGHEPDPAAGHRRRAGGPKMSSGPSARDPVIIDVLRSPIGRARKGALADVRPDDLAAHVLRELLARNAGVDPAAIGDVLCGCAFPWGEQGYNVGRSIGLLAGLPHHVPAQTITRLCASSLQAVRSAAHTIAVGEADLLLTVGVESVSRVGRGLELATNNPRLDPEGDGETVAAVFMPMGLTAELVADDFGVTREQMDRFAERSQQLATRARDEGLTTAELLTV